MKLVTGLAGLGLVGLAAFAGASLVSAQDMPDGRTLVEENCGVCHATGKAGGSPNGQAPPLRTISHRFSLDDLQEMLERGTLFAPHPQMPHFKISRGAARAMTIYLRSIQD